MNELMHFAHNAALVGAYVALGSALLPMVTKRLLPHVSGLLQKAAKAAVFLFFWLCAFDHFEDIIHVADLPSEYFEWDHLLLGVVQSVAAWTVTLLVWSTSGEDVPSREPPDSVGWKRREG